VLLVTVAMSVYSLLLLTAKLMGRLIKPLLLNFNTPTGRVCYRCLPVFYLKGIGYKKIVLPRVIIWAFNGKFKVFARIWVSAY